jgi:putative hydrolase of the HAD superfamily
MAVKLIMVDIDGVVVHPQPQGWSANLERDLGLSGGLLHSAFFKPHFVEVLCGRVTLRDRLGPVLEEIAPHLTCDRLIDYWFENDSHLNDDLLQQLAQIRGRGLKLHLATVQEHERAAFLWQKLGLREHFDAIHYSADLGWVKPAAEFFAEAERRSGFSASEIFFIDDRIANVEGAREHGWRAAVWTGEKTLDELLGTIPP